MGDHESTPGVCSRQALLERAALVVVRRHIDEDALQLPLEAGLCGNTTS